MKKGSTVSICSHCRKVFKFSTVGFKERPVGILKDVTEIGIECPNCQQWQHCYYLNPKLVAMQVKDADRKHRREYQRKFVKFQGWVAKKVRNGISDKDHQSTKDESQAGKT